MRPQLDCGAARAHGSTATSDGEKADDEQDLDRGAHATLRGSRTLLRGLDVGS